MLVDACKVLPEAKKEYLIGFAEGVDAMRQAHEVKEEPNAET